MFSFLLFIHCRSWCFSSFKPLCQWNELHQMNEQNWTKTKQATVTMRLPTMTSRPVQNSIMLRHFDVSFPRLVLLNVFSSSSSSFSPSLLTPLTFLPSALIPRSSQCWHYHCIASSAVRVNRKGQQLPYDTCCYYIRTLSFYQFRILFFSLHCSAVLFHGLFVRFQNTVFCLFWMKTYYRDYSLLIYYFFKLMAY